MSLTRPWRRTTTILIAAAVMTLGGCGENTPPGTGAATPPPAPQPASAQMVAETPEPAAGLAMAPYPADSAHKNAPPPALLFQPSAKKGEHGVEADTRAAVFYTGWELGTNLNITIVTDDQSGAARAIDRGVALVRQFNVATSSWMPGTDITNLNAAAGVKPVKVSALTLNEVQRALTAAKETDGAFDPTWAAMWGLWNYSAEHPKVPTDEELARALPLIDYRDVMVDETAATIFLKRAGMKLDLGGITKGSLTGQLAALLKKHGFHEFLIQLGGEMVMAGKNPEGHLWKVGMQHPRKPDYFVAAPELTDCHLSTSGDYERFFMQDGKRYHHIIDPKTGRPSRGLIMVTVIGADGALCDAYATALMVMGQANAEAFLAKHPGLKVVTINHDGEIWSNDEALRKQYPPNIEAGE